MDSILKRDRSDSTDSNETMSTVHPEDSISNVGKRQARPPSYGPMAAFLASPQEPQRIRDSMLPDIQILPPRSYRANSPIPDTPELSSSLHHPNVRQTRPTSLEPSTPGTFTDSSRPLGILNYGEPHAFRPPAPFPKEGRRVPSLVMPTARKFVRFEGFKGQRFWPFDAVSRDETSSLRSAQSGDTEQGSDSASGATQAAPRRVRDSRWVPAMVDPWAAGGAEVAGGRASSPACSNDVYRALAQRRGDLIVRNSADCAAERAAFFAGEPVERFRGARRVDSGSAASSESSRLSQHTVDGMRRDHLRTVRSRPASRQAEFFFLPNEALNGTSWSVNAIPPPQRPSGSSSSASADTIDVRDLEFVGARERPDGLVETVSRTTLDGMDFTITSTSREPEPVGREAGLVSHRNWLSGWEDSGLCMAQQEREEGTKLAFLRRLRGRHDSKRDRTQKWWQHHLLNRLGIEQIVAPETVAADRGKSNFIAPGMSTDGNSEALVGGLRPHVPSKGQKYGEALSRARTEVPRRPPVGDQAQHSRPEVRWKDSKRRSPIQTDSEVSNWEWKDAHCDVFRSNAFKGKSLDLSRGNTKLPLPADRERREKIREPRIRGFLERWVSRRC